MSILRLAVAFVLSSFKSQHQLVLENLALRQQVTMLRQSVKRPRATPADKLFGYSFLAMWIAGVPHCMPCIRILLYGGIGGASVFIGVGRAEEQNLGDRQ